MISNQTLPVCIASQGLCGGALAFAGALASFSGLYFGFAAAAWFLTRTLLPQAGIGAVVDARPLREGQIPHEIRRSMISIVLFGGYGLLVFEAWRAGVVEIDLQPSVSKIAGDLALLFLWNELHFYCLHRLFHTRWLYRHVHRIHHESVVATPFSTYSFHWLEAVLLGSVLILPMLVYKFSLIAVLALPAMSIFFNTIGHCNYNVFARRGATIYSASVEHSEHHRRVSGNYGFYLPFLDRLAKTSLARISR